MLLGFSRGSVGDLTFYRRNAQQITRARARVVKNPKTLQQQMQRAIMRTSVEAYKVIKEICDHSYEGVAYGANSYAEFQKQNMAMLRRLAAAGGEDTVSFLPSGFNGLVAMPWILSKGSIAWTGFSAGFTSDPVQIDFGANIGNVSQLSDIGYSGFIDAFGLQAGDQLTLIAFPKRSDIDESSCLKPIVSRIILSPASGDMGTQMFTNAGKLDPAECNPLCENTDAWTFKFQTGRLLACITGNVEIIGAAAIISRRATDGSWLRSASVMEFNSAEQTGGYTLRQASMVVNTEITTPSDWYLNNANEAVTE